MALPLVMLRTGFPFWFLRSAAFYTRLSRVTCLAISWGGKDQDFAAVNFLFERRIVPPGSADGVQSAGNEKTGKK
jgi:hypothetical protein